MAVTLNHELDPRTELGALYAALADPLERIVRGDVRASDVVIEDACQFAWTRLVDRVHLIRREAVLSWLVTTAVREAFKLIRRSGRDLSLDAALESAGERLVAAAAPAPDEVFEQRERLDAIRVLPERQQRLLWLHALGLSYAEMALHTGDTPRTVERQLLRAKRTIRDRELTRAASPES
jgi:RNA polymerase sigma factor (sigma-70 family)